MWENKNSNFRLTMLLLLLCLSFVSARNRSRKGHRSAPCSRGCLICDGLNGCSQCKFRMFLYINTIRNRQFGVCKHNCPSGYFGQRERTFNKCTKCEVPNCKSCFTSNYCTACQNKFYLQAAKCEADCHDGLVPNSQTGKCEEKIDCAVGSWSTWSKCARRSPSRSCKYGRKKRTRNIVQQPTENGKKCPKLREARRCRTSANDCICEWNKDMINKWIKRMDEFKKRMRDKRKKGKKKGKKRKRKNKVEDNSTGRFIEPTGNNKNVTSSMGLRQR